jgi:hypothetical protein
MKTSSKHETMWETYVKTWDNCTPVEGSQPLTRECMPEKKSVKETNYGSGFLCDCESGSCYDCGI